MAPGMKLLLYLGVQNLSMLPICRVWLTSEMAPYLQAGAVGIGEFPHGTKQLPARGVAQRPESYHLQTLENSTGQR